MSYVFQNIFMCLLIAGIIGGVVGWILHRLLSGSSLTQLENDWSSRLEGERTKWTASLGEQEGLTAQWKGKFAGLEGDFATVQARIPTLEADLKACGEARTALQGELAGWTEKAKAWDGERASIVAASESKFGDLSGKLAAATAAVAAAAVAKTALDGEASGAKAEIESLRARLADGSATDGRIKALEADLAKATAEAKRFADLAKADSASYEEKIGDLTARLAAMQEESTGAQSKLTEMTALVASKSAAEESASGEVGALRAQIDVLREQLQTASAEAKRVTELSKADIGTYEEQLVDLKARLATMQEESTASQSKLTEMTALVASKSAAEESASGEVGALRAQIDVLREQLQTASAEAKRVSELSKADIVTYEEQLVDLKSRLAAMQDESTAAQSKLTEMTALLASKSAAEESASGEVGALRAQIDVLREQLQTASTEAKRVTELSKADIGTYEEQLVDLKSRLATMQEESTSAQSKLADMTGLLTAKSTSEESTASEVAALRAQIDVLREQHQAATAEAKRVIELSKADIGTYEEQLTDLKTRLATMQEESTTAQAKLTETTALLASKSTAEESAASEVAALRAQIDVLREQHQSASAEAKRVIELSKADIGTYEEQLTDLRARLATMQQDSTATQSKLEELHALHTRTSADAENKAGEISALRAQLDTTRLKLMAVESSTAAPVAALAAAAGVGGTSAATQLPLIPLDPDTDTRYDELKARFDRFVVSQQREGYGDIERIEGIGPVYGQKLRSIGIAWVKTLLAEGASAQGRKAIVTETGLDPKDVLTWVNAADLLRIEGMTPDWAELLEESGVDTVKELRTRVAENLQKKMEATNPTGPRGRFAPTVPDVETVQRFIDIAKTLEPKVTH